MPKKPGSRYAHCVSYSTTGQVGKKKTALAGGFKPVVE